MMNEKSIKIYRFKTLYVIITFLYISALLICSYLEFTVHSNKWYFLKFHPTFFMLIVILFSKIYSNKLKELNNKIYSFKENKNQINDNPFLKRIEIVVEVSEINRLIEKLENDKKEKIKYCVQSIISTYLIIELYTFKFITIKGLTDVSHFSKNSSYFMIGVVGAFVALFPYFIQPFNWFMEFIDNNDNGVAYFSFSFVISYFLICVFIIKLSIVNNPLFNIITLFLLIISLIMIFSSLYNNELLTLSYFLIKGIFYLFILLTIFKINIIILSIISILVLLIVSYVFSYKTYMMYIRFYIKSVIYINKTLSYVENNDSEHSSNFDA